MVDKYKSTISNRESDILITNSIVVLKEFQYKGLASLAQEERKNHVFYSNISLKFPITISIIYV